MEKKQNSLFLLKQWIPIIIIWGILLFGMFGLIRQDNYMPIPVIAIAGTVIWWTYTSTTAQFNKLLKSSSPQPLIDYYDKKIGKAKIPHKDANLVFTKALAYTLYGYFDSARTEVDKINWEQKPPLYQAQKIYLLALWAYLEKHDFRQGINLAKEARRLTEVSKSFPGANASLNSYDIAIDIGELLSGNSDPSIVIRLESKITKSPMMMKVLVAWGLEGFYNQSGQVKQAKKMREIIINFTPHCKGLSSL